MPHGMQDLVCWPGIESMPPALVVAQSLIQWNAREVFFFLGGGEGWLTMEMFKTLGTNNSKSTVYKTI